MSPAIQHALNMIGTGIAVTVLNQVGWVAPAEEAAEAASARGSTCCHALDRVASQHEKCQDRLYREMDIP